MLKISNLLSSFVLGDAKCTLKYASLAFAKYILIDKELLSAKKHVPNISECINFLFPNSGTVLNWDFFYNGNIVCKKNNLLPYQRGCEIIKFHVNE